jgi:hypothetical protein
VTKCVFALCPFKDRIPSEIFFEWMRALGPMLMPHESAQIGMPSGNEAEHISNLALVPLRGVDMWRDGRK